MLEALILIAAIAATAPIRVAVRVDINRHPTFVVSISIYGIRLRFTGAISGLRQLSLRREGSKRELKLPVRRLLSVAVHLYEHVTLKNAEVNCRVGTGDACQTAMAAAGLASLLRALGAFINAKVSVTPDFSRPTFSLTARCILFFRGGDIIPAVIRAFQSEPKIMKAGNEDGASSN